MTDERFDALMRDAARTYNRPPDEPPTAEMWEAIRDSGLPRRGQAFIQDSGSRNKRSRAFLVPAMRAAALLIVGIGLGRGSVLLSAPRDAAPGRAEDPYRFATNAYLGETANVLFTLPTEMPASQTGTDIAPRAEALLRQTRLLLDSPAAADSNTRSLLEDLEVVLAQLNRLNASRQQLELDLLNSSLEHRAVLSRLRTAVTYQAAGN
jgi:hypothetical protein